MVTSVMSGGCPCIQNCVVCFSLPTSGQTIAIPDSLDFVQDPSDPSFMVK